MAAAAVAAAWQRNGGGGGSSGNSWVAARQQRQHGGGSAEAVAAAWWQWWQLGSGGGRSAAAAAQPRGGGGLGCIFLFSGIYFLDKKTHSCQDSWGFLFFPVFSEGIFHRNVVLEGVAGIPDFRRCHRNFFVGIPLGQEFLYLLWIPPDSSEFLRIPVPAKRCLALASD
jgi:hypothetical protein